MKTIQKQAKSSKMPLGVYVPVAIAQCFSMLSLLLATAIHWALLVSITVTNGFYVAVETLRVADPQGTTNIMKIAVNTTQRSVLILALVAVVLSALLLFIEENTTARRRTFVNSVSIIVFCVLATLFSQLIVRSFLSGLIG